MAGVASSFKQWSTTTGSNNPTSATTIGAGLAPNFQQIQATLRTELGTRSTALTAAATTDLSTKDEGIVLVSNTSGTIAISSFGTVSAGIQKLITFSVTGGALSLVYNSTSLILPSLANLTVANGDSMFIESLGSGNWKVHAYFKATGMAGLNDVSNKFFGIVSYTATSTASASDVGYLTYLNAATAQTLTLPSVASCPIGTVLSYVNIIGVGTWTIQRGGSSLIFGMGSNNVTSIQLIPQSSIQFTNDGTNWIMVTGSNLSLLGANGTSYTSGVNYQAPTDGFVFGRCFSSASPMSLTVFSDSTATPTTTLIECGTNTSAGNYWVPFCVPIKKGNFWRIVMGAGSAPTINFTPMGV